MVLFSKSVGEWSPRSWREKVATQQPDYPDPHELDRVLVCLSKLPPLVTSWEVEELKRELGEAARGNRFLLQGGDCSESFVECRSDKIANKLKSSLDREKILFESVMKLDEKELQTLHNVLFNSKKKVKPKTRADHCVDMKVGNFILPIVD